MSTKEEMNLPLAACVAHAISAVCELEIHDREIRDRLLIELTTTLRYINNPLVSLRAAR